MPRGKNPSVLPIEPLISNFSPSGEQQQRWAETLAEALGNDWFGTAFLSLSFGTALNYPNVGEIQIVYQNRITQQGTETKTAPKSLHRVTSYSMKRIFGSYEIANLFLDKAAEANGNFNYASRREQLVNYIDQGGFKTAPGYPGIVGSRTTSRGTTREDSFFDCTLAGMLLFSTPAYIPDPRGLLISAQPVFHTVRVVLSVTHSATYAEIPFMEPLTRRKPRKWGRSLTARWEKEHSQLVAHRKFSRNTKKLTKNPNAGKFGKEGTESWKGKFYQRAKDIVADAAMAGLKEGGKKVKKDVSNKILGKLKDAVKAKLDKAKR